MPGTREVQDERPRRARAASRKADERRVEKHPKKPTERVLRSTRTETKRWLRSKRSWWNQKGIRSMRGPYNNREGNRYADYGGENLSVGSRYIRSEDTRGQPLIQSRRAALVLRTGMPLVELSPPYWGCTLGCSTNPYSRISIASEPFVGGSIVKLRKTGSSCNHSTHIDGLRLDSLISIGRPAAAAPTSIRPSKRQICKNRCTTDACLSASVLHDGRCPMKLLYSSLQGPTGSRAPRETPGNYGAATLKSSQSCTEGPATLAKWTSYSPHFVSTSMAFEIFNNTCPRAQLLDRQPLATIKREKLACQKARKKRGRAALLTSDIDFFSSTIKWSSQAQKFASAAASRRCACRIPSSSPSFLIAFAAVMGEDRAATSRHNLLPSS